MPRSCSIRLPVALLLEKRNNGEGWFDLAFFGQRLAIFGQPIGHSCVVCALG
jgi:hypothetical protein